MSINIINVAKARQFTYKCLQLILVDLRSMLPYCICLLLANTIRYKHKLICLDCTSGHSSMFSFVAKPPIYSLSQFTAPVLGDNTQRRSMSLNIGQGRFDHDASRNIVCVHRVNTINICFRIFDM